MSSKAARCSSLRLSLRPSLSRRRQLSPLTRSLTVDGHSDAHIRLRPRVDTLQQRIQHHIGREAQLDAIRAAFIKPGKQNLRPNPFPPANDVNRTASPLSHHQRNFVEAQLQRCGYRADYLNLVTSILAQPDADSHFKYEAVRLVCDALCHSLTNARPSEADAKMLVLAHQIRFKLEDADLQLPQELIAMGLLCAATCHSLPALKLYLREHRKLNCPMSPLVFARLVDAVVSYVPGHISVPDGWEAPLNEARASAVLLGFPDAPVEAPYDLSAFVPRESWNCLDRWLRALARYKLLHQLRLEWALWLQNPLRTAPQSCVCPGLIARRARTSQIINEDREAMLRLDAAGLWNTQTRGDLAFVEAFRRSAGFEDAWMVLKESGIPFDLLKRRTRTALLAYPEFAAPELWTDQMRASMLENYAAELAKIEALYGVEWVWDEEAGAGYHRISGESFLGILGDQYEEDTPTETSVPWTGSRPKA